MGRLRSESPRVAASLRRVVPACAAALALAGCGAKAPATPHLTTTAQPTALRTVRYPADGVALQVPGDWSVTAETSPLVAVFSSGPATIALWRYPTTRAAPRGSAQLRGALSALERAARRKDPTLQVLASGVSSVDGAGAVIIDALEHVSGKLRRVRSEHVYVARAELVLEAYAPPAQFPSDDHLVFSPVRKSMHLLGGAVSSAVGSTSATTRTGSTRVGSASATTRTGSTVGSTSPTTAATSITSGAAATAPTATSTARTATGGSTTVGSP